MVNAGSPDKNMGIIHGMAQLYRETANPRYLRMAEEVHKDFQQAGDYYRTGLAGKEFFRTSRPRWESLHSLQGLVELYRITGDPSYYGPMRADLKLADGTPVVVCEDTDYPHSGMVAIKLDLPEPKQLTLALRIPLWSTKTEVTLDGQAVPGPKPGEYKPWIVVDVPAAEGGTARLIDFASAGAATIEGKALSQYVSWLPATGLRPPRPVAWRPADGGKVAPGPIRFTWRAPAPHPGEERQYAVLLAESPEFHRVVLRESGTSDGELVLPADQAQKLHEGRPYYWKLVARNKCGTAESIAPYKQFTIDPTAPAVADLPSGTRPRDKMLTEASLHGDVKPGYGKLLDAKGWKPAERPDGSANGAIAVDGETGLVKYALCAFPDEEYSVGTPATPSDGA